MTAQRVFSMKQKNQRVAMQCLRVLTISMVLQKNVIQVIFAKVKPPIKPLAHPDSTPPTKDPLPAMNAHLERMPTLLARLAWAAKIAPWGLLEQKTTMRPNANDATQV
jgi:DNA-binding helix-hairpin-helix protein with protein kinase domain